MMTKFGPEQRSTFPYWFAHWCAFQMTALNCHVWKFRYFFHDMEKPWLKLIFPYKKVQKFHRRHNKHHIEWLERKLANKKQARYDKDFEKYFNSFDFEGAIIDWESCHYTKSAEPLDALGEYNRLFDYATFSKKFPYITAYCYNRFSDKLMETIKNLELYHE